MSDPVPSIDVVYALPDQQAVVTVNWNREMTLEQAVRQSGLLHRFPEIRLVPEQVGVFGERQPLDYVLEPGDRVELYRPLKIAPTEARRLRAGARKKPRDKS